MRVSVFNLSQDSDVYDGVIAQLILVWLCHGPGNLSDHAEED